MMAISLRHVVDSNDARPKSTATHVSGAHRDSDQDSCYATSIGCMISMCSMMPPRSIPTHSSHSLTEVIPSSHFGCRAQMAVQLIATNSTRPPLQEVGTLSFL